jgi:hypothetical protein
VFWSIAPSLGGQFWTGSAVAAPLLGTLDEVALYGAGLSAARVSAHYAAGAGGGGPASLARMNRPILQAVARSSAY